MDEWPGIPLKFLGKSPPTRAFRLLFKTNFRATIQVFFFGEELEDQTLQENVESFLKLIFSMVNRNDFENRLLKVKNELYSLLQRDDLNLKPAELIAFACPIISNFFNAERTTFFVYNEKDSKLQSIHAQGPTPLKIELKVGEGLVGACFQSLQSFYTNMPYAKREFQKKYDRESGFVTRSSLVAPLYNGSTPFGVLQVLNRNGGFTPENLAEIEIIAKTLTGHLNFYQFTRGEDSAKSELESLLQTIPEVLYRLDLDGNFGFISQEVLKWGYFREELIGKHFSHIIHPDDIDRVSRDKVLPIYAGKVTGQKGAPGLFDERRSGKRGTKRVYLRIIPGPHINYKEIYPGLHRHEEEVFHAEVNASGFWEKDPSGQSYFAGTMGLITDVTERFFAEKRLKSTQNDLIRAERFAGLGTLSAGIAHDFNNILAAISLSADVSMMLMHESNPQDRLKETLSTIGEYVEKASDLTSRLLVLGSSNISKVGPAKMIDIVQDATQIIKNQLETKGISLNQRIEPNLPICLLDHGQLRDALINLITNSMHSIMEKMAQKELPSSSRYIRIETRKNDQELFLIVEDNGTGIDPKILPRIFDPLFTTKNRDSRKGTGLGLSMVYSVVQSHGGSIHVDSKHSSEKKTEENTSGTVITIRLPIQEVEEAEEDIGIGELPLEVSKQSLIYVVDDEQALLELTVLILNGAGFTNIKTFTNGMEALEELLTEENPPLVILTDVVMPPLDGLGLCKETAKVNLNHPPKFIVMSGRLSDEVEAQFRKLGVIHFLKKPCTKNDILNRLSIVLREQDVEINQKRNL